MDPFADRVDAGSRLAALLLDLRGHDVVVLGLPRGGVPVAAQVAAALDVPLDVIVVRKLGLPWQPELAMGAIGEDGVRVLDTRVIAHSGVSEATLLDVEDRERRELDARVAQLRAGRPRLDLAGRTALVVDDGMATGSTARAACQVARQLGATTVVMAVPVAARDTVSGLREADRVVCVLAPRDFRAVGRHYRDFTQTTDEDVMRLLAAAHGRGTGGQT
jgi:putative phosphoribosyl transferase